MSRLQRYYPFMLWAPVLCLLLLALYPHYQYYVDPDGTAYLTIARRYATGDVARAINGYWSPWACWLTAGLMRAGLAAIPAGVVVNSVAAIGFLYISQCFFLRFGVARRLQWSFGGALAFFLCYAVFWQSFDDLWECFFLLAALRLLLADGFMARPRLWVLYGVVGGLAYFAKAYALPFFMLSTVCCVWVLAQGNKKKWLVISAVSIATMMACALPWVWALHGKYGIWTTSTSGSLNLSWYLVGHPEWKQGIKALIPPAYPDSPYYWEDPWYANGATPHFWDSLSLLGSEVVRTGYHCVLLLASLLQLSVFMPLIAIIALLSQLLKKQRGLFAEDLKVMIWAMLLFPSGYLLINFEARYLWYMVPLSMALGAVILQSGQFSYRMPERWLRVLLPLSYIVVPAFGLMMLYNRGKMEYRLGSELKAAGVSGSFTGNFHPRFMSRVAYFSGNAYYFLLGRDGRYYDDGLYDDMSRYGVTYYIHCQPVNSAPFSDDAPIIADDRFIKEYSAHLQPLLLPGVKNATVYKLVK